MELTNLTHEIIGAAHTVFRKLGAGFLEKVYENAMVLELKNRGISVKAQHPVSVYYDGSIVGDYIANLFVENKIIVELKAEKQYNAKYEIKLANQLYATKKEVGILINFGDSLTVKKTLRHIRKPNSHQKA